MSRKRRARDRPLGSGDDERIERAVSAAPDPERQAYAGELGTLLESALATLPHGYRSVFMLREVDGLNTAETAQRLRVVAAVMSGLAARPSADAGGTVGDPLGNLS